MITHEHPAKRTDRLRAVEFRFTGIDWMEYHELSPHPCLMLVLLPFNKNSYQHFAEKYVYCSVLQRQLLPLFGCN